VLLVVEAHLEQEEQAEHKEHLAQVVLLGQEVQVEHLEHPEREVQVELLVRAVLVELVEWVDQLLQLSPRLLREPERLCLLP
jgi:hypothetical protein